MVELTRTIRFAAGGAAQHPPEGPRNGFGGTPPMAGLSAFYELEVSCLGEPDPATGYLINIKDIDVATRSSAVRAVHRLHAESPHGSPIEMLPDLANAVAERMPVPVSRVRWVLSPYFSLEHAMNDAEHVVIRQQFDFCAAHRLHAPELSDEENRRVFGKCNNPSGHGHNYRVEPAVAVRVSDGAPPFGLGQLERLCHELVIERFDHTHLNLDTTEFGEQGVIPSVENIARVIHGILGPAVEREGAKLRTVTVWETDRTRCTYPAG